jgi:hypothetical protein
MKGLVLLGTSIDIAGENNQEDGRHFTAAGSLHTGG